LRRCQGLNTNDFVVSLDIGTSKVRVIIGELNNSSINIIGVGSSESEGIKKGAIVDIDLTVQSIRRAVESAERMVGISIEQVFVGIAGNHIKLQPSQGVVAVSSEDREIGEEDIIRVIDASKVVAIPPEREIIDVVPKQFIVDGLDGISDPRGMLGVRLEMEGTIITGSRTVIHNLVRCIERAGLSIAGIFLQPLAASSLALTKDEKSMGIVLADIGAGQTTVSIFDHGSLIATTTIPVGGEYITNDIAIGLRTTTDVAEKVKTKHGCAFVDDAVEEEMFKVPKIGSNVEKDFSQVELANIIEPRVEEVFDLILEEVRRLGYSDTPGGFVLTGGVVSMPGVLEVARLNLQNSVRIAIPDYIGVREAQYTTGVGIIKYAYQNIRRRHQEVAATVAPANHKKRMKTEGKSSVDSNKETIKDKVKSWFKELI
jgi:cell division protein FtsA